MTTLLVKFSDRDTPDETVECDSWDTVSDPSGGSWFQCKRNANVIFQASARDILFFRVVTGS